MRGPKPKGHGLGVVCDDGTQSVSKPLPAPSLKLKGEALRFYEEVGRVLYSQGVISSLHLSSFSLLSQAWGELQEAFVKLEAEGPTIKGQRGSKLSPWLSIVRENRRFLAGYLGEFGLTPIGTKRLGVLISGGGDDLDKFLRVKQSKA